MGAGRRTPLSPGQKRLVTRRPADRFRDGGGRVGVGSCDGLHPNCIAVTPLRDGDSPDAAPNSNLDFAGRSRSVAVTPHGAA